MLQLLTLGKRLRVHYPHALWDNYLCYSAALKARLANNLDSIWEADVFQAAAFRERILLKLY